MVMGSAQRNALNKTALGAANALTNWSTQLVAEMEKQGVGRYTKRTPIGKRSIFGHQPSTTDDKETVTFERWRIRQLLDEMAALKEKLLRFEKPTVPDPKTPSPFAMSSSATVQPSSLTSTLPPRSRRS
jgi:hypothetical protein